MQNNGKWMRASIMCGAGRPISPLLLPKHKLRYRAMPFDSGETGRAFLMAYESVKILDREHVPPAVVCACLSALLPPVRK